MEKKLSRMFPIYFGLFIASFGWFFNFAVNYAIITYQINPMAAGFFYIILLVISIVLLWKEMPDIKVG